MPPTINSNKSISEASFGERSTCFWKKDGEYLCERGERARKKTAGFRSKGSPETAVKQAGQHESHEPGQEDELVAHVERHDLVDFRYVTESARIAVGVHGVDDHADDPREAEQEDHQRYGQPQGPVEKDMMFGDVSRRGGERQNSATVCSVVYALLRGRRAITFPLVSASPCWSTAGRSSAGIQTSTTTWTAGRAWRIWSSPGPWGPGRSWKQTHTLVTRPSG